MIEFKVRIPKKCIQAVINQINRDLEDGGGETRWGKRLTYRKVMETPALRKRFEKFFKADMKGYYFDEVFFEGLGDCGLDSLREDLGIYGD